MKPQMRRSTFFKKSRATKEEDKEAEEAGNFLTSWVTIDFPRKTMHCGISYIEIFVFTIRKFDDSHWES